MITRWTVDQEIVGFESHPRQKLNFCRAARFPDLLNPFGKMSTGFQWQGSCTYGFIYLRRLAVVSDFTVARFENDTRPDRHKQPYTGNVGHRICPPSPTSPHHTPVTTRAMYACRARCEKQQKSHVITWARIRQVLTPREVE